MKTVVLAMLAALATLLTACETTDGGKRIPAQFYCDDGVQLRLVFDHEKDAAVLRLPKDKTVTLPSQHPASGMYYAGEGYELRGAGDTVKFTGPDRPQTRCVQRR